MPQTSGFPTTQDFQISALSRRTSCSPFIRFLLNYQPGFKAIRPIRKRLIAAPNVAIELPLYILVWQNDKEKFGEKAPRPACTTASERRRRENIGGQTTEQLIRLAIRQQLQPMSSLLVAEKEIEMIHDSFYGRRAKPRSYKTVLLLLRVSDGVSPCRLAYAAAKRPKW